MIDMDKPLHSEDAQNCPNCETGRYQKREPEVTSPLQTVLTDLKGQLEDKRTQKYGLQETLNTVTIEFDALADAIKTIEKLTKLAKRTGIYYVASRTSRYGRPGHFIESFDDNSWKCSCEGFTYNGKCWASAEVKTSGPTRRSAYRYILGESQFDKNKATVNFKQK